MKKSVLFLFIGVLFSLGINAQSFSVNDNTCPPVPWVNAEMLENGDLIATWVKPCDTCNNVVYRVGFFTDFNPCRGEDPLDGVLTMLNYAYLNTTFTWQQAVNFPVGFYAISVQAVYDTCNSERTASNVISIGDLIDPTFQFTANISLEDGGNPEGANVEINGTNCFYDTLDYFQQTGSDGISLFDSVMIGTYNITVSKPGYQTAFFDNYYLYKDSTINVELKIDISDVTEMDESENLKIYPNPVKNQLNIESKSDIEQITLINNIGQTVLFEKINNGLEKQIKVNTSELKDGIYILKVKTEKETINRKVLIHH